MNREKIALSSRRPQALSKHATGRRSIFPNQAVLAGEAGSAIRY